MPTAPTASEWMIGGLSRFINHLARLGPEDLAVNSALSVLVALVAWGAVWTARRAAERGMRRLPSPKVAERVSASRAARLIGWTLKTALTASAAYLIGLVWGVDLIGWAQAGVGAATLRELWRLLLLTVIAAAAFEFTGFSIGRLMDRLALAAHDSRRAGQLRTLKPLLRAVSQTTVGAIALLTLLSELGIKIGPLLAGAGVAGVAVGFGAQNLVKDFLTGLFLVMEDVVAVGDTVEIATFSGRVEAMTLRTIRLRDFNGTLHIFPYSEAPVIHNATNLFAYAVIDVQVPLAADVDKAIEVMRKTGEELSNEPETKAKVLQPIEVLGVDSLAGSGVHLKGRIKTLPAARDQVARAYYHRLKPAFEAAGIALS